MEAIRRAQLIDAAVLCLHEEGYQRTTVIRTSERAGLSTGMIRHYFSDKSSLLAATLFSLNAELAALTLQGQKAARSPQDRLHNTVGGLFESSQFAPRKVSAWLELTVNGRDDPKLLHLNRMYERRLHSNLVHALRQIAPHGPVERTAHSLSAMITGLWMKAVWPDSPIGPDLAREMMSEYVDISISRLLAT